MVAVVNAVQLLQVLDSYAVLPDHLCPQALVQHPAKRVSTHRAIRQRSIRILKRSLRPLHKLRKMEQKRRLNLVFVRRFVLAVH
jgi:hypothetical protein